MKPSTHRLRQMGVLGFGFFLVKGLAWLGIAAVGAAQAWI